MKYLIPFGVLLVFLLLASCSRKTVKTMTSKTGKEPAIPTVGAPVAPPESALAVDDQDHGLLMIALETTPCSGNCAWYTAKFYADGSIFYNGKKHVKFKGVQNTVIKVEALNELIRKAEAINFFGLKKQYPINNEDRIMDLPATKIMVRSGNLVNTITAQNNVPDELTDYLIELNTFLNKQSFRPLFEEEPIEKVPEEVSAPNGDHGTLQLTIIKMPCYGSCPWYEASFYDDGTIIYHGKKHVDYIGEYQLKTTPAIIRELTKSAKKNGLFTMSEQYPIDPTHAISDLPKVHIMVKDGRTSKTIIAQNETPELLRAFIEEVESTLMRQEFAGHRKE